MMNNLSNMMMGEQLRKMDSTFSPKSSPHGGGRSPVVARQDSSGTLKTTISLSTKTPTIIHTGPFYSMKEPPGKGELTGDKDLMTEYGLHHTLTKFKDKKIKESLASFLPNLPGINDGPTDLANSTLRSIIEKPPIVGKEILPLNQMMLAGFRLHPGPLPEEYRTTYAIPARKHKNKHKKHKSKDGATPPETTLLDSGALETYEKKHKKQKRHEDDKERKKRKKEKKRKKRNQSPELNANMLGMGGAGGTSGNFMAGSSNIGAPPGVSTLGVMGHSMPPTHMQFAQQMPGNNTNLPHHLQQQQQQLQQQHMMPGGSMLGQQQHVGMGGGSMGPMSMPVGNNVGPPTSGMLMSQQTLF